MPRSPSHTSPATSELANSQIWNGKERGGGELGGSINNYSLKIVDQTFIQIKYIIVHRINLINLRKVTQCSGKSYTNYNKFKRSKVLIYLK